MKYIVDGLDIINARYLLENGTRFRITGDEVWVTWHSKEATHFEKITGPAATKFKEMVLYDLRANGGIKTHQAITKEVMDALEGDRLEV